MVAPATVAGSVLQAGGLSVQATVALATIGIYLAIGYRGWQVGPLDVDDWMAAGRGLGIVVLLFTFAASYHSAFAFLGIGGFVYANGIGIFSVSTFYLAISGLILWVVGSRVWLLAKKHGYITPSDLLGDFYESPLLAKLVNLSLILVTFPYIATQMIGSGIIFETATQGAVSFELGAAVFLVAGVIYVWLGGMRAVAWTDAIQSVFMFGAMWLAGWFFVFSAYRGPGAFWAQIVENFAASVTMPGGRDHAGFLRLLRRDDGDRRDDDAAHLPSVRLGALAAGPEVGRGVRHRLPNLVLRADLVPEARRGRDVPGPRARRFGDSRRTLRVHADLVRLDRRRGRRRGGDEHGRLSDARRRGAHHPRLVPAVRRRGRRRTDRHQGRTVHCPRPRSDLLCHRDPAVRVHPPAHRAHLLRGRSAVSDPAGRALLAARLESRCALWVHAGTRRHRGPRVRRRLPSVGVPGVRERLLRVGRQRPRVRRRQSRDRCGFGGDDRAHAEVYIDYAIAREWDSDRRRTDADPVRTGGED